MATKLPTDIHQKLSDPPTLEAAVEAMKVFIDKGDPEAFQHAVAVYCAGARERGEQIETVLVALERLAKQVGGPLSRQGVMQTRPTEMHTLIFGGILRAFYGDAAVDREAADAAGRKAEAHKHTVERTWPRRPKS